MSKKRTKANALVRAQLAKERARLRNLVVSLVAAGTLLIAGVIGWGVYQSQRPTTFATPARATANGDGLVVGSGPVTVDVYLDFLCPACKRFEDDAGATMRQMITDGRIKAVFHPVAILDELTSTKYSTRSAASFGCAATVDGDKLLAYLEALYAQQPPENSAGLTDDRLIEIAGSVGISDPKFGTCVRDRTYHSWVARVTEQATDSGMRGTPTVRVNGKTIEASAQALSAAVGQG